MAALGAATWLVVPTYDEAANIEAFVAGALERLPAERRVLIVDDASPDGTGEIADRLAAADPDVEVLHRPGKEGLGPAYVAGFREALAGGAQRILTMDADFSHDPGDLPRLLATTQGGARPSNSGDDRRESGWHGRDGLNSGPAENPRGDRHIRAGKVGDKRPGGAGEGPGEADLVIGSRYVSGGGVAEWGPLRRLLSRGGSAYSRLALGIGVRDLTGGFKCYRREVLEAIGLESLAAKGYAFQVETTYRALRAGFRVAEIPIVFTERRAGASKMSRSIFLEAVWRVPAMRLRRGAAPGRSGEG